MELRKGGGRRKSDEASEKPTVDNGPKTPKGEIRAGGVAMATKSLVAMVTQPTLP